MLAYRLKTNNHHLIAKNMEILLPCIVQGHPKPGNLGYCLAHYSAELVHVHDGCYRTYYTATTNI